MAKLISVVRSDDYPFDRRQIPLNIDDNLTMVAQFSDTCAGCNPSNQKQKDLERFVKRYMSLDSDEVAVALMVTSREMLDLLSPLVPCVGCRNSVERLFNQLVSSGHPTLEPLVITPNSVISIRRQFLFDPKAIYALLYVHGSKLNEVMECIPKSKKNKRCQLHSLDSHKGKSMGNWQDVWEVLSDECREEVVLIKCQSLLDTIDFYLRKHRFCTECKSKVQHAYRILVKEVDHTSEKGYSAELYSNINCCRSEGHVHLPRDTDYIRRLIERAEPEMFGSQRERHAKTLDIAQEEVLTCLGINVYERLQKIGQRLRAEEQTWQILFYLAVDALRKNFELALERKQGVSNLELMCEELLQEERAKEQKRKHKQQKKKKKKTKKSEMEKESNKSNCDCDENTNVASVTCNSCDMLHSSCQFALSGHSGYRSNRSDCGYSSEGGEVLSLPSSREGSDVACSEGICNHDGDRVLCQRAEILDLDNCLDCNGTKPSSTKTNCANYSVLSTNSVTGLSLLDMLQTLEDDCSSPCEEDEIPQEEIQHFLSKHSHLVSQRNEYRQRLRRQFANLQLNCAASRLAKS